ncbi:MAG: VOC family protein [Acidobacteriota bacterium]|nr:VOC family protein [Acidobacteriota bacterium]
MNKEKMFESASAYQDDILALPVIDLNAASNWYCKHFGMVEVERSEAPVPTVVLERDGVRIGFALNGGDASQDGAAFAVSDIRAIRDELESNGVKIGNWRIDERDGKKYQVFFVVAPDGLCYYFHQLLSE